MRRALRSSAAALLGLGAALAAAPAEAQRRPAPLPTLRAEAALPAVYAPAVQGGARPRSTERLVAGGVAFGAVGLVGGALAGTAVEYGLTGGCGQGEEFCGFAGALLGSFVGEVAMIPLGVHLANGGRGRYWPAALASAGVAVAGLIIVPSVAQEVPALILVIPAAQIGTSIHVERRTAR